MTLQTYDPLLNRRSWVKFNIFHTTSMYLSCIYIELEMTSQNIYSLYLSLFFYCYYPLKINSDSYCQFSSNRNCQTFETENKENFKGNCLLVSLQGLTEISEQYIQIPSFNNIKRLQVGSSNAQWPDGCFVGCK